MVLDAEGNVQDPLVVVPPTEATLTARVIVTSFKGAAYKLYFGPTYRYDNMYIIQVLGDVYRDVAESAVEALRADWFNDISE